MKIPAYVVGGALIAYGAYGLASHVDLIGWAIWFGGAVLVHDLLFAPAVLLAGAVVTHRRTRAALVVAGAVTLVALPMVLGLGKRADNPSILPLPYGRNLLIVLAVIAVAALLRRKRPR
ncbi:hypothetical protein [Actinomadura hibisca]|uniref:hypothetical protein n=1 Tax=Actinomadura hibisca TaxID=68565 RepID=UPI0009FBD488|nr:hypothetical protein [Actinomadura hibisca]